ncbi:MAG: hypothetical protein MZV70_39330 [Desulfobacterales bacterium]|nr:hypothetical protein [Desulfobacterales bacterium]
MSLAFGRPSCSPQACGVFTTLLTPGLRICPCGDADHLEIPFLRVVRGDCGTAGRAERNRCQHVVRRVVVALRIENVGVSLSYHTMFWTDALPTRLGDPGGPLVAGAEADKEAEDFMLSSPSLNLTLMPTSVWVAVSTTRMKFSAPLAL